jgi:hypothetical protein
LLFFHFSVLIPLHATTIVPSPLGHPLGLRLGSGFRR